MGRGHREFPKISKDRTGWEEDMGNSQKTARMGNRAGAGIQKHLERSTFQDKHSQEQEENGLISFSKGWEELKVWELWRKHLLGMFFSSESLGTPKKWSNLEGKRFFSPCFLTRKKRYSSCFFPWDGHSQGAFPVSPCTPFHDFSGAGEHFFKEPNSEMKAWDKSDLVPFQQFHG